MADLEVLGERFAQKENDADADHWDACELAFEASLIGRSEWAWVLSKSSGKGDDQVRNRRNSWAMYLELIAETELADEIKEHHTIFFSHFSAGYKKLYHRDMDGVKVQTDMTDLVELFITARDDEESVVAFSVSLDDKFGKDLQEKFFRQLRNWIKRGKKLWHMSEYNGVSQGMRFAMQNVIRESEKK